MSGRKIVIALGGNAILSDDASADAQKAALEMTAEYLVKLIQKGDKLIISHGNGPQVGNLLLQQQAANTKENPEMPLDTCVAMTQGSIGYWMENALIRCLKKNNIAKEVATIVTQVVVDENDSAFKNPTKPIGPFLTKEQVDKDTTGMNTYIEDAGRGYRKVVASPKPIGIQEYHVVNTLVDNDIVTIAGGGGGIPIVGEDFKGVEAVIDKDFASEKLAELVDADLLVILTGVDHVFVNYGKENEQKLEQVTVSELEQFVQEGHFAPGSMLPKVEAAMEYVKSKGNRKAIITSLENIEKLVDGEDGTIVTA